MSGADLEGYEAKLRVAFYRRLVRAGARPEKTLFTVAEAARQLSMSVAAFRAAAGGLVTIHEVGVEWVPQSELALMRARLGGGSENGEPRRQGQR